MYVIGMILLVAALLSRPTAAVVPVALFAILWWKRGRIDLHREFLPLLPLLVVSAGIAALAGYMEVARAGATGAEWQFGSGSLASELTARVLMAGQAIWFYFGKLIWPFPTMFNYPQWDMTQSAMWAWIFPIATFVVLAGLVMSRDRIGRGPICAVIIFLAAVFPVLGFINVRAFRYAIVWDYFAHWALIPMLALIAAGAVQFWVRRRFNVGAGIAIAGIVLFFLTGFSYRQANAYANSGRLWDDTLRKNPTSTLALNELGRAALDRGDFQRARAMFERVLAVDPLNAGVRLNFGLLIEASGGRLDDAIAWYVDAVDLRQRFPQAWQRLGMAYQRLAMERRDAYRSLKPGWQQWWWGWSLRTRGDELLNAAIASYQNAIVSDANNLTAVMQLAALHAEFGRFDLAIPNYRRALELDEKNETARDQLAFALDMVGQHEEALGYWEELRLENPDNPRVLNSMGLALARRAQWEAAAVMFQNAVRADPRFVEGWHNLGLAQAEAGDLRTAITNFERALAINPQYAPSRRALDSAKTRLTTQPAE
jgi:tetratricopeptide (TPR) repeat protein